MTLIPGPSPRRASRLGWWAVGGVLALAAAFWLAERIVDLLWMGGLGYRTVFWQILDLRFGLFAAAFVPLCWLSGSTCVGPCGLWRAGAKRPAPRSIPCSPSSSDRSPSAGRCPSCWRSSLRSASPGFGTTPFAFSMAGRSALPIRYWAAISASTSSGCRCSMRSCVESSMSRSCCCSRKRGSRRRARRLARLGAARRSHAELDGTGGGMQPRRAGARRLRWLCPRPLPPALRARTAPSGAPAT